MTTKGLDNGRNMTATERSIGTVSMSTAGLSDVLDQTGLALAGIQLSTGIAASLLAFNGSMGSTDDLVAIHNAIGGRITLGSTVGMAGKMIVLDPPMFAGLRYLQVATITSTGGTVAQTTADTIRLCVTDRR